MNTEPKNTAPMKANIAMLEAVIEKNTHAIRATELTLRAQMEKQMHRLADLRFQKAMLKRAEDFAAYQQRLAAATA